MPDFASNFTNCVLPLEKGAAAFYINIDNPMTACNYRAEKDNASGQQKVVFMLSTCHQPAMESVPWKNVQKPRVIRYYNIHMGGVDRVDQQLHGFRTLRKSYKWYKKFGFRLMMQMTLNAHKVFQKSTEFTMNRHSFIHEIIATLITLRPSEQKREPIHDDTFHHLSGRHFISVERNPLEAKDQRPTKRCRECYASGIRTKNGSAIKKIYVCRACPSESSLHPETCFEIYHTKLNYDEV